MEDNITVDENGNFTGSFSLKLSGCDYIVPITISVEKIMQEQRNAENPDSREKEIIDDDEMVVPFKGFYEEIVSGTIGLKGDIGNRMFGLNISARADGYNNVVINKIDYANIIEHKKTSEARNFLLNRTAQLNNIGIALEKERKFDEAILVYEENIELGYPATHSFERLLTLYRKNKDVENEIRIIELAIEIFTKENERRANASIQKHPSFKEKILDGLTSCSQVMGDNGFYCFVPYDEVVKYKNRFQKLVENHNHGNHRSNSPPFL